MQNTTLTEQFEAAIAEYDALNGYDNINPKTDAILDRIERLAAAIVAADN